jgi:hypothetical protein
MGAGEWAMARNGEWAKAGRGALGIGDKRSSAESPPNLAPSWSLHLLKHSFSSWFFTRFLGRHPATAWQPPDYHAPPLHG